MCFDIFKANDNYVFESNKNAKAYMNKFGDMTKEEFRRTYTGLRMNTRRQSSVGRSFMYENDTVVLPAMDWRQKGAITGVKNQGKCVSIEAAGQDFQFYSEGVFIESCGTKLDHRVGMVGYGTTDDGTKVLDSEELVGSRWGEQGYIRMQRDVSANKGLCGIAMEASYPIKASPNLV
ncbi:hypothetical protein Cni_G10063 [Canna indica]|uniref:Peptidase C1A papain C-terminal domain-containing protein n=1 Tax=Canna indica TaxID=4628 RepID=A0AAQ3K3R7_9LILI|nr:hypothetical protein Cni_G10063 [Canna indica]